MYSPYNCINCPEEYFEACLNAYIRCKDCSAGEAYSNKLYFKPLLHSGLSYSSHPQAVLEKQQHRELLKANKEKKKVKSKQTKDSLRKEKEKGKEILDYTLKSGAINADGDYTILQGQFQADHKWTSKSKSFTLSDKEYKKGKNQSTDTWMITNCENNTVVVLTQEAYCKLVALAKKGLDNNG